MFVVWLAVQWVGLALAAMRVPLAAEYPQPAEFQAVHVLLTIQLGASALLSPGLCRNWRATLAGIVSGGVLLLFAGCLAGWTVNRVLPVTAWVSLWIVALYLWQSAMPTLRFQACVGGLAAAYAIGGAFLWYLRLELNGDAPTASGASYGPLAALFSLTDAPERVAWVCIVGPVLAGMVARGISAVVGSGRKGNVSP